MEKFLNQKLNLTTETAAGTTEGEGASAKVENYLNRLDSIAAKERGLEILTNRYIHKNTIDTDNEELLEKMATALYESKKQQAINEGHGASIPEVLTEETLEKYKEDIKHKAEIQIESLQNIIDYVANNEDGHDNWFRYYMLRSIPKMGKLDADAGTYTKRSDTTVAPYLHLNHAAVGFVKNMLIEKHNINEMELSAEEIDHSRAQSNPKKYRKEQLRNHKSEQTDLVFSSLGIEEANDEIKQLFKDKLQKESFADLYAFAQLELYKDIEIVTTEGIWKKFDQGSDPAELETTLQGQGTGWCTEVGSAPTHIEGGDFYVYYTYTPEEWEARQKGEDATPTQPGIAIRMLNGQVYEVRGIETDQQVSPDLIDIAHAKYSTLPGGDKFEKKRDDMNQLTSLYEKYETNAELTADDLRFLYEIDEKIDGFGYRKDPRINEMLESRDKRTDLSQLFDCRPEQISFTKEEALSGDIVYHHGSLSLRGLTSAEHLTLPETIQGDLHLESLTSAEHLKLPDTIQGSLILDGLISAEHLILPDTIQGSLILESLTSAEHLKLPDTIQGSLRLNSLTSAEHLILPDTIQGSLILESLTSAEHLKLPDTIQGSLRLNSLSETEKEKLRQKYPQHAEKIG